MKTETVDATSLDSSIAELFRLHEKRWQARGEPGVVGNPVVRAFHEAAARALAREHMLTAYRLSLDDATLAVYYGCAAKSAAYAYLIGFDPDRTDLAPGAQIIAHAIGEACTAGLSRFDFLRGDEPYKYSWGAVDRPKLALRLAR